MLRVGLLADDVGFDKISKKGDAYGGKLRTLIASLTLLIGITVPEKENCTLRKIRSYD
ncbi:hypothetical protein [Nostoc sp.]|uniref:hypothetical protein n=1 Tax=Nostoc sp. TaxID=1180 RepID=UPI002FF9CA77